MCYLCSQKRGKGEVKSKSNQKCYARPFRTKTEWVRKLLSLMTFYSNRSDPLASRRFLCNRISCAFDYQNKTVELWEKLGPCLRGILGLLSLYLQWGHGQEPHMKTLLGRGHCSDNSYHSINIPGVDTYRNGRHWGKETDKCSKTRSFRWFPHVVVVSWCYPKKSNQYPAEDPFGWQLVAWGEEGAVLCYVNLATLELLPRMLFSAWFWARGGWKRSLYEMWKEVVNQQPLLSESHWCRKLGISVHWVPNQILETSFGWSRKG